MGSSIFTPGIAIIAHEFNKSVVITTLGLSLYVYAPFQSIVGAFSDFNSYVLGFATGPIFFAPLSEVHGRRIVQVPCWALFVVFQIGCALSHNIETFIICRFFVGMFGSPALTVAGGVMHDLWPRTRPPTHA